MSLRALGAPCTAENTQGGTNDLIFSSLHHPFGGGIRPIAKNIRDGGGGELGGRWGRGTVVSDDNAHSVSQSQVVSQMSTSSENGMTCGGAEGVTPVTQNVSSDRFSCSWSSSFFNFEHTFCDLL